MDIWNYRQIVAERQIGNFFTGGVIKFLYRMPMNTYVNLDKSFIRMRCKLSKANGAQLTDTDDIAPNYLLAHNLIDQIFQCCNGVQIGEQRAYVAQCAALIHRTTYPKSYKDGFLASTNFGEIDFRKRQNTVITNGIDYDELTYQQETEPAGASVGYARPGLDYATNTLTINTGNGQNADAFLQILRGGAANAEIPDLSTLFNIGDVLYISSGAAHDAQVRRTIIGFQTVVDPNQPGAVNNRINLDENLNGSDAAAIGTFLRVARRVINTEESYSFRTDEFEICFKPAISLWHVNNWLPSHDMELKIYPKPENTYQLGSIQSINANKIPNTDYVFNVEDMIMWVAEKKDTVGNGEVSFSYPDLRCQLTNITTTSNVDNQFVVDREAYAFTVCMQDEDTENSTLNSASLFKIRNDEELKINRVYVDWNGQILPNPYPLIEKTSSKDFITQRYYESIYYGDSNTFLDAETQAEYEKAGIYFTFKFGKNKMKTEKVTVSTLFEPNAFENDHKPNLLLFDHFSRSFKYKTMGGRIVEIHADKVN